MSSRGLHFRVAGPDDAGIVAALHTDSWRRHYRGAYSDAFLDEEAPGFLSTLWTERLTEPEPRAHTLLAESEDGVLVGLAHTILDQDPDWGAFVDNLHVRYAVKRLGIGSRLLALTAQTVRRRSATWGLHLWVLEQNTAAQAFYTAQGGKIVERAAVPRPAATPPASTAAPSASASPGPTPGPAPAESCTPGKQQAAATWTLSRIEQRRPATSCCRPAVSWGSWLLGGERPRPGEGAAGVVFVALSLTYTRARLPATPRCPRPGTRP